MSLRDGPKPPRYPLALIHPLGPLFRHLPLSLRRHLLFLRAFRKWGDFRNPQTWREKMQWRILNDRRTILSVACDKLGQRVLIEREITAGGAHAFVKFPEVFWVGTDVRELRRMAAQLPPRWVLKPNHSSGRVCLLDANVSPLSWEALIRAGDRWMQPDEETQVFGHSGYAGARRLLIAEERVGSGAGAPDDVRITCFDGKIFVSTWSRAYGTLAHTTVSYLGDLKTRVTLMPSQTLTQDQETTIDAMSQDQRNQLTRAAELISQLMDHVRVDFYVEPRAIWFSELTVYSTSGLAPIMESENQAAGALWRLPDLSAPDPREAEWRALLQGTPKGTLQT
jgi:hypothetical protein